MQHDVLLLWSFFSRKNFQSTWRGSETLPGTTFALSDNGWMTTEIFLEWFCKFADQRPLILIYDGHSSHVSIKLIEKAMEENITLLKLRLHVTDELRPLDVGFCSPLKRELEAINERFNLVGTRNSMIRIACLGKYGKKVSHLII